MPETYNRDNVDLAAEREAAALQWLSDELGNTLAQTRLDRERELRMAAIRMGLKAAPYAQYKRAMAVRAWLKIVAAFSGTGIRVAGPRWNVSTAADRQRRRAIRAMTGRSAHAGKLAGRRRDSRGVLIAA